MEIRNFFDKHPGLRNALCLGALLSTFLYANYTLKPFCDTPVHAQPLTPEVARVVLELYPYVVGQDGIGQFRVISNESEVGKNRPLLRALCPSASSANLRALWDGFRNK